MVEGRREKKKTREGRKTRREEGSCCCAGAGEKQGESSGEWGVRGEAPVADCGVVLERSEEEGGVTLLSTSPNRVGSSLPRNTARWGE